ncbi:MAG: DUF3667 domain-containing protein [Mizugakiibacter sp.]|uniref:DUF3667 domain-containing protein n=1 Tax=Mizugakiibacter sp. TaxID=1972610 RepID=UPI0031C3CB7D|nr:DUF3667 domain-containing protein [Xanthomonadaceae bacterium]
MPPSADLIPSVPLVPFIESATDLDGRVWRTLRVLLFAPGLLSREYLAGRRARWLPPVSLFLAISVVYFLAPIRGGDLTLQFIQQVSPDVRAQALEPGETLTPAQRAASGQWYSAYASRWVERRVAQRDAAARAASNGATGYTVRDYRAVYEARADDVSKALVILHVPLAALVLMLAFWRQRRYYAEHFVVVLHYFAFWIVALTLISQAIHLIHWLPPAWQPPETVYDWVMRALLALYAVLALRRAYAVGWPKALIAAAAMIASIVLFNLYAYRAVQFAVTFALT